MIVCPNCNNGQMIPRTLCGTCNGEGFICATCKLPGSECECDDAEMFDDYLEFGDVVG